VIPKKFKNSTKYYHKFVPSIKALKKINYHKQEGALIRKRALIAALRK